MNRSLLALCARDLGTDQMYAQLRQQLVAATAGQLSWEDLVYEADRHGLAPLLLKHLQYLDWPLPHPASRLLRSLALRARLANRIRNEVMVALLDRCQMNGVGLLLVKGIALANCVYSDPGLRPMRDIDILVREDDLTAMQAILSGLGYHLEESEDIPADYYHLKPMVKMVKGMQVTIEVHRALLPAHPQYPCWPFEAVGQGVLPMAIEGTPAHTLSLEIMLRHVYLHGMQPPLTYEPLRFVHVADLVSLVEQRLDEIDWDGVQQTFPAVRTVLAALHCLTPWSDRVIRRLHLQTNLKPVCPGEPYQGWPRRKFSKTRLRAIPQLLRNTLWPGQWWLQIYYGCSPGSGQVRARLIDHPRSLYRWIKAYWLHFLSSGRLQSKE